MPYKPPVRQKKLDLGATPAEILRESTRTLDDAHRRVFLKQLASLGGLSLLTGAALTNKTSVTALLNGMSKWNDGAQAMLFKKNRLAPEYTLNDLTQPFPFNAFYPQDQAPAVDPATYRLTVSGLVQNPQSWTLDQLRALPQTSQITRHICVEGWSAIGRWGGIRFSEFLQRSGADLTAKYIGFKCADDYATSIDMPTALHPQTLLTLTFGPTLQPLPREYGFPLKLRMPTKLGFKNPKHIIAMNVTNTNPGGYWEDQGYNWFSGS